jgi:hypothetical protein
MARRVRHALHDILEVIERVETITHDKTLAQFEGSWELRWLVQRAIEIISEASRAVPAELTSTRRSFRGQRQLSHRRESPNDGKEGLARKLPLTTNNPPPRSLVR